jgi:Cysteine-rich secretory protein family
MIQLLQEVFKLWLCITNMQLTCIHAVLALSFQENLAWGAPSMSAVIAVNGWADEVSQYSYNGNSCSGVCGHYTQMIWADTTKVGCGTAKCGNLSILGNEAGQVSPYLYYMY